MNLYPNDLLLRKTNGKDAVWVSQRLLVEVCGISDEFLRTTARKRYKKSVRSCDLAKAKNFLPESGKAWRWGKQGSDFYYCYQNIPDREPCNYRSMLGTEESLKQRLKELSESIKIDITEHIKETIIRNVNQRVSNEDIYYFRYDAEVLYPKKQATELAIALAYMQYLKNLYETDEYKTLGVIRKQDLLDIALQIFEKKQLTGLKINSAAYLRRRLVEFPNALEDQRASMISDKHYNDNARKVGKYELVDEETGEIFPFDAHQALMYNAYMSPMKPTKESIYSMYIDYYCPAIEDFGYEPVAYRTFCMHLAAWDKQIKTAKARHGKDYFRKHFLTYVPSKKLQYSHSLFAGDGSGTIAYKYYKKNAKGNKDLSMMKLYVIMISDVASRKIVGWAVAPKGSHKETSKMTADAVKMAVETCNRMTMFEFVSDNHGAFTSEESKDLLNLVFNKRRTIEPGNSQANPAETEFRLFKQSLKRELNFISSSWGAGIEGQSNPDYLNIDDLPTYEDAVIQMAELIDSWNSQPLRDGVSPNERFLNRNPNAYPMDDRVLRQIFGNQTKIDPTYGRGFIKVSKTKGYHHRENYLFEIPDFENTGVELITQALGYRKTGELSVVWDEQAADLYTLEGKFIMTCYPAQLSSQAYIEADLESNNALGHHLKRKGKMEEKADEFLAAISGAMEAFTEDTEDIPYLHQMQTGGNKESYNATMEETTAESLRKQRANRKFDEYKYNNL